MLDILPSHYSHLPGLIQGGVLPADVLLLQVSPPDEAGRHSLGLVREYLPAVLDKARVVIAEVNPAIPWTHGGPHLQAGDFALLVDAEHPPLDQPRGAIGAAEQAIARHIAGLIEDGATLQLGVGNLPEAVLAALHGHRDLGLHSGAVTDGIAQLAEAGVLTNARKSQDSGVGIGGILMGGETLRRWAHLNPQIELRATDYTHDPVVLAKSHKLAAINAAIEVDLTGQINAEVAAGCYVGAVGGAVDFLRGAAQELRRPAHRRAAGHGQGREPHRGAALGPGEHAAQRRRPDRHRAWRGRPARPAAVAPRAPADRHRRARTPREPGTPGP